VLKTLFTILSLLLSSFIYCQTLKGVLTDENGSPLPGANIYLKNSYVGVVTDKNGFYELTLSPGQQTVIVKMMGFNTIEKLLNVNSNKLLKFDTTLSMSSKMLNEAVVTSDIRSLGKSIMQNVRDKRKDYLDSLQNYECDIYRRISLENLEPKYLRDSLEKKKSDSLNKAGNKKEPKKKRKHKKKKSEVKDAEGKTVMVDYVSLLNETISTLFYERPSKYHEAVVGENTYDIKYPGHFYYMAGNDMSQGIEVENMQNQYTNPYVLIKDAPSADFNFYRPTISQPSICIKPLLSPIAPGSALSYIYDYDGVVYNNNKKCFRIKVKPVFRADALYSGYFIIEDSTWSLQAVDLSINPDVLLYCKNFRIQQTYIQTSPGVSVPEQSIFTYQIKEGKGTITGTTGVTYSHYIANKNLPPKTFSTEVKEYQDKSLEKDSAWWADSRPYKLSGSEKKYIKRNDSLSAYYNSDAYIFKTDSSINHLDVWSFLYEGISHLNRKKQTLIFIFPLLTTINPLGIGGYRQSLGGSYFKRFSNDFLLETEGNINYGFTNKDLRGKAGVGLTYVPEKFVRTYIRAGDFYDQVNTNASITSMFSRSNYARTKMFSIAQRMELVNGLFGEITFTYSDQTPITDLKMDQWSGNLFGSINTPLTFTRYIKSEFQLELKYLIRQKYIKKNHRKILLGSSWPELSFIWKKGVPGLFNSEVNFDYLEISAHHELKLARWGRLCWSAIGGAFVNKANLRILEYKYFRGSDKYFFSSPTRSLQLLGPTLSSSTAFLQLNFIHHFEGAITDKIPLMSRLKLGLVAGGGALFMKENNFRHGEMFGGIERVFRIRRQLFRIGIFAVTSDNNLDKAAFTFKAGINMYNNFSRKWDY